MAFNSNEECDYSDGLNNYDDDIFRLPFKSPFNIFSNDFDDNFPHIFSNTHGKIEETNETYESSLNFKNIISLEAKGINIIILRYKIE